MRHDFGPSFTPHWGPAQVLAGPSPLLRAELLRLDEHAETGETVLYLSGETHAELSPDEADIFIAQAQAFVDGLRVMRRQMGRS
jgi:hypothetical protein